MPDARLQTAIANWALRFTSQGVDYNDFVRTTQTIETWAEWLDAWSATGDIHAELAQGAEAKGRWLSAGEAWVRAALCYHFAKFVWMVGMEKYRATADKAVSSLYAAPEIITVEPRDILVEELEEFAACIRGEATPETGPSEALAALEVIRGAIISHENGQIYTMENN